MSYPSGPYPQQPNPGFPQASAGTAAPQTGGQPQLGGGFPQQPGPAPQPGPALVPQPGPGLASPSGPALAAQPGAGLMGQPGAGLAGVPSSGTTTIAAILAVIGGVAYFAFGIGTILRIPMLDPERGVILMPIVRLLVGALMVIGGIVLIVGAIMLFTRKPIGRLLTIIGCGAIILVLVIDLVFTLVRFVSQMTIASIPGLLGVFSFPAATLVLAMIGPTKRYLATARPNPRFGQPPQAGYPQPQPGYPQPQPAGYPQQPPGYPPQY